VPFDCLSQILRQRRQIGEKSCTGVESPQFEIQYSDEKVTARGGMQLMKKVLGRGGVGGVVGERALPEPGSTRGFDRDWSWRAIPSTPG
jgi:hypothetical protein